MGRSHPIECSVEGCTNLIARYATVCPECLTERKPSELEVTDSYNNTDEDECPDE